MELERCVCGGNPKIESRRGRRGRYQIEDETYNRNTYIQIRCMRCFRRGIMETGWKRYKYKYNILNDPQNKQQIRKITVSWNIDMRVLKRNKERVENSLKAV